MAAEIAMAIQARTVIATIKAHGLEQDTKAVRFAGESFADLKARMVAANLPGLNEESFFEVKIGEEFVCLLDSEVLPPGDIHVRVFTLPTGNEWHKPVDGAQDFYTEQYGPYHYGHHHHGHHLAEEDSHGFEELGKENCTEKNGKKGKHEGKAHHHKGGHHKRRGSHSRSRSRGRSHSPGRRSHSPRCRGMRGRHMHRGRHGPGGPHCGPHPHHRGMRRGLHHFFGMHHGPRHFGIHFHGPPGMGHGPHFAHGMPPFPGSQCPACNSGRGEGEPSASAAAKDMAEEVAGLALVSSTTGDN